jgi:hypothetical protein
VAVGTHVMLAELANVHPSDGEDWAQVYVG